MSEIEQCQVASAIKWSFFTEIAVKLVSPITNMILARLLMPSEFGLVATITIVTSFAEVLTDAGFQKYIIQHEFADEKAFEKSFNVAFWSNICFACFIFGLIFAFRNSLSNLVGAPELGKAIIVASISIVINSYSSIQVAAFKRKLEFRTLFYARIILSVIPFVVTIPLAYFSRSFWALVIGGIVSSFINFIIFIIKPCVEIKMYYSFRIFKEMFSFSFWTLLESITIWLTTNADIFIVAKVLNDYYLGLYKTAMNTVTSYMNIISSAVIPVLFATLSRYQNDNENFKKYFFKFQKLLAIMLIPMGFGLFLFRGFTTTILLGKDWFEAADFIGLYSLFMSFTICIAYLSSEVFRSKGNPKVSMLYQWLHIILLIPTINLASHKNFQTLFITKSFILLELIISSVLILKINYGFSIIKIIKNIVPQTISASIMFIVGLLLKQIDENMLWQVIVIIICVFVYFAIVITFKTIRKDIFEIKIVKNIILKISSRR